MDGNEHAESLAGRGEERRAHPRYAVDEDALLLLVNHGMPVRARMMDLSVGGCRVRTQEPFAAKAGRTVEISFKVKGFAFRFGGVVRWSDGDRIVGIHFENMIPRRKAELIEVVDEMAETAARAQAALRSAAAEPAPTPSLLQPKTIEATPARLELVKPAERPAIEKAVERAAPAQPGETPAKPPVKPRDRRTQARHEIDSTATIFLVKVASALRGRIVDLSLGGCRIRTDEKFPVGIYTRVEIEFHLQGLPFRLGGVIQAIHNRNTVGIRLLDLSERKRQQVQDLIDELDEVQAEATCDENSPAKEPDSTQNG